MSEEENATQPRVALPTLKDFQLFSKFRKFKSLYIVLLPLSYGIQIMDLSEFSKN